ALSGGGADPRPGRGEVLPRGPGARRVEPGPGAAWSAAVPGPPRDLPAAAARPAPRGGGGGHPDPAAARDVGRGDPEGAGAAGEGSLVALARPRPVPRRRAARGDDRDAGGGHDVRRAGPRGRLPERGDERPDAVRAGGRPREPVGRLAL